MTFDPGDPAHLATGKAHAPLAHAVGTGEVELEGIGSSRLGGLADLAPVLLRVATHDTGYHNLGGEGGREGGEGRGGREGGLKEYRAMEICVATCMCTREWYVHVHVLVRFHSKSVLTHHTSLGEMPYMEPHLIRNHTIFKKCPNMEPHLTSKYTIFRNMPTNTEPHLIREIPLELGDAAEPVGGRLLADELDVEEGALPRAKHVARGGATDDAWRHVGDDVLGHRGRGERGRIMYMYVCYRRN